jgi:catechol-2,3-dioxygenase
VLLNVADLQRSITFYQDVFELRLLSQQEEVAALMVYEKNRSQVLVLRELRRTSLHPGGNTVGLRMLSFEAETTGELDAIQQKLADRGAVVWHGQTETYRAIMGVDPDRTEICVAASVTGAPISSADWEHVDDTIYAIE